MIDKLDFNKLNGIIPAIVQDANTLQVLMIGFMNKEALEKTLLEKKVTFWSRSRKCLWQKGETSGNSLEVISIETDCDNDALLIKAIPKGPVCHTGSYTCFGEEKITTDVLNRLEAIIADRKRTLPENSYSAKLFKEGTPRIAQKVGEEAVEVAVAATLGDKNQLKEEIADLLYHIIVLLKQEEMSLDDIFKVLQRRMK